MRVMRLWSVALTLLTAAAFTGCITAEDTPNSPSVGEHNSELSQGTAKQHCVISSVAQPTDGTMGTVGRVGPAQCFATFPEAISAATNGRVQLPPSATRETVDDQILNGNAVVPNATFVIGIEFVDTNFQGATLTFTNSVTCAGFTHTAPNMPPGWNDVITSAEAFSNCNHSIHFENTFLGGASIDCGTGCSSVGSAMNDRTSSIRWNQ